MLIFFLLSFFPSSECLVIHQLGPLSDHQKLEFWGSLEILSQTTIAICNSLIGSFSQSRHPKSVSRRNIKTSSWLVCSHSLLKEWKSPHYTKRLNGKRQAFPGNCPKQSVPGWEDCSVMEIHGATWGPKASHGDTCTSFWWHAPSVKTGTYRNRVHPMLEDSCSWFGVWVHVPIPEGRHGRQLHTNLEHKESVLWKDSRSLLQHLGLEDKGGPKGGRTAPRKAVELRKPSVMSMPDCPCICL